MSSEASAVALRSRSFRSDRIAWFVFLVVVAGAIVALRAWLHHRVRYDEPAPAPARADFRLAVLAYDRVGGASRDEHWSADRVAEHFEALRAAGFHPVSLRQVHDAYRGGEPLPGRPLLIAFDGGHLTTYQSVDPLLRRLRWPAVMFLDPRLQQERHATYVYWDRLQRMIDSGVWDIAALGRWPESAEILERHLAPYRVLAGMAARRPAASDDAAPSLAFENGLFGVNDAFADPRRLFRVRVPTRWSGRELVKRLRSALAAPAADASGDPVPVSAARWAASIGRADVREGGVTLSGQPRAEAWIAGSEWARDFVLEAEVRPESGVFWIVQDAVSSPDQWRWGGTGRRFYLERLRPGAPIEVISAVDVPRGRPGAWHSLRVIKRGEGVWAEWDGARLPEMPRRVSARWRGHVGISTGSPKEPGRVTFRHVRFAQIPYRLRAVSASPGQDEIQALLADAARLAAISPPLLPGRAVTSASMRAEPDLLAMVAAQGAWDIVPGSTPSGDPAEADPGRAPAAADEAEQRGWAGVRVIAARLPDAARQAWSSAAPLWHRAFARRGLRFVLDLGAPRREEERAP